jgi:hypothetical protein
LIGEILEIASFIAFLTMGSFIGLSAAAQSDGMGLRPILNPKVLDLSGNEIQDELIPIGGQVTVSIRYPNYKDEAQFSIVIIEIRDSEGVTIFLAWQSNTTPISGAAEVGVSWTPPMSGDYQIRAFQISNWTNPISLEAIGTTKIKVIDPSFVDFSQDAKIIERTKDLDEVKAFLAKYQNPYVFLDRDFHFQVWYQVRQFDLTGKPWNDSSFVEPYVALVIRLDSDGYPTSSFIWCTPDSHTQYKIEDDVLKYLKEDGCQEFLSRYGMAG